LVHLGGPAAADACGIPASESKGGLRICRTHEAMVGVSSYFHVPGTDFRVALEEPRGGSRALVAVGAAGPGEKAAASFFLGVLDPNVEPRDNAVPIRAGDFLCKKGGAAELVVCFVAAPNMARNTFQICTIPVEVTRTGDGKEVLAMAMTNSTGTIPVVTTRAITDLGQICEAAPSFIWEKSAAMAIAEAVSAFQKRLPEQGLALRSRAKKKELHSLAMKDGAPSAGAPS
ncbi:unnamed protein product, partial [Phaeothamnion confervicola]